MSIPDKRNYLRARGEYSSTMRNQVSDWELPPRTRRIQWKPLFSDDDIGTTSAHAENTPGSALSASRRWNYLRARGEYGAKKHYRYFDKELPPRTRRIPLLMCGAPPMSGTTSAHAENTRTPATFLPDSRNYLRARGEYISKPCHSTTWMELPPRTRRIHENRHGTPEPGGTTSAHAENTAPRPRLIHAMWNYLRARGEYCEFAFG